MPCNPHSGDVGVSKGMNSGAAVWPSPETLKALEGLYWQGVEAEIQRFTNNPTTGVDNSGGVLHTGHIGNDPDT